MNKLSGLMLALGVMVLPLSTQALDLTPDGIAVGYGKYIKSKADLSNTRVSLQWDWNRDFISSPNWKLGGYFDLAVSNWRSHLSAKDQPSPEGAAKAWAVSFSPVFRFEPETNMMLAPFFDFGVGASWQSKKDIEKKLKSPINMGGHTQFEIRAVAGVRFGTNKQYELSYGWFHYSNANFHPKNEALDFQMAELGWRW